MSQQKHLDLSRYVPALVNFLNNKLSAGASTCHRKHFGVGVVEWRILSMLAVESGITANRISQVIGLDKSAVSRAVQTLQNAGYVDGQTDDQDARKYTLSLTDSGQQIHDRVLQTALERERRLLGDFTPEEVDTLVSLLTRMHARVDDVNAVVPGE